MASGKSLALEMVGAAEGQGREILSKWTALARAPSSYGQIREFIEDIDAYSSFIDLTEAKINETKPDRTEEILAYLSQLRVQLLNQKLSILKDFMTGLIGNARPMPMGGKGFFTGLRNWVKQMRSMNNEAIRELGAGPLDAGVITVLDALIKQAVHASRDFETLDRKSSAGSGAGRARTMSDADRRMLSLPGTPIRR